MKLRNTAAAFSLGVLTAFSINASANGYVSVFGAYTDADNFDFSIAPGTVSTDFDKGVGAGIAVGRTLSPVGAGGALRAEGELSYRTNDVDTHRLNGGAVLAGSKGSLNSTALMGNLFIDFNTSAAFTPYVGAGVGIAQVDADGFGVDAIPDVLDDSDTVFAYQIIAGAGFDVSETTEIFVEYRYFATEDPGITTSAATGAVATDISYNTNNFIVGARFSF